MNSFDDNEQHWHLTVNGVPYSFRTRDDLRAQAPAARDAAQKVRQMALACLPLVEKMERLVGLDTEDGQREHQEHLAERKRRAPRAYAYVRIFGRWVRLWPPRVGKLNGGTDGYRKYCLAATEGAPTDADVEGMIEAVDDDIEYFN